MSKEWLDNILNFAESELERINFDKVPLGKTSLCFIEHSAELCNYDPEMTKKIMETVLLLVDGHPISPITEEDFKEELFFEKGKTKKIMRCTRYKSVYIDTDGKCYDDNAVLFIDKENPSTRYYLPKSKKEVFLPYFPNQEIIYI